MLRAISNSAKSNPGFVYHGEIPPQIFYTLAIDHATALIRFRLIQNGGVILNISHHTLSGRQRAGEAAQGTDHLALLQFRHVRLTVTRNSPVFHMMTIMSFAWTTLP